MDIPKLEIKTDGTQAFLKINGEKLDGVRKISFTYDAQSKVPIVQIDMLALDMTIDTVCIPKLPYPYSEFYMEKPISE